MLLLHLLSLKSYLFFLALFLFYQFVSEVLRQGEKEARLNGYIEKKGQVMVIRRDEAGIPKKQIVDSKELVPGDLIEITNEMSVPADVVLLFGSCVVQEKGCDLKRVSKTKIPFNKESEKAVEKLESHHVIQLGSKVQYTMNHINEGCYAIVLRTGFATEKGSALRKNLAVQYKELFIQEDLYQFYTIAATLAGSLVLFYLIQQ